MWLLRPVCLRMLPPASLDRVWATKPFSLPPCTRVCLLARFWCRASLMRIRFMPSCADIRTLIGLFLFSYNSIANTVLKFFGVFDFPLCFRWLKPCRRSARRLHARHGHSQRHQCVPEHPVPRWELRPLRSELNGTDSAAWDVG